MKKITAIQLAMELLWWLITAIIVYMVISPIYGLLIEYPFLVENIVYVVVFITFTRYLFLLKNTPFSQSLPIKGFFIFACLPLIVYLLSAMFNFQIYLNEQGHDGFIGLLHNMDTPFEEVQTLYTYFRREMIFFGAGSIIVTIIFPFRMLVSIWRVYNKTGKV